MTSEEPTSDGLRHTGSVDARAGVQFGALAMIWGFSFLLIKLAERSFAPLQVSFGRVLIGAVTLSVIIIVRRQHLPASCRTWGHLVVAATLLNALPFTLFAYGERDVSSVLAGIWNATTPLFTLPVAIVLIADERATRERKAGLLVGFVGVLTVLGVWHGIGGTSIGGNLLCLGAAFSYGVGFPYTRRFLADRPEPPTSLAAGQLICASAELAILTPLLTNAPHGLKFGAMAALAGLGAVGTGLAYILNFAVIRAMGAMRATTLTYVIPVFSTIAGIAFLSEPLTFSQPVGAAIILLGAAIGERRVRPPIGSKIVPGAGTPE